MCGLVSSQDPVSTTELERCQRKGSMFGYVSPPQRSVPQKRQEPAIVLEAQDRLARICA